jgi:hypothetical protein
MGDDWNARFSSMMFKVLQGAYKASPIAETNDHLARKLGGSIYEPFRDEVHPTPPPAFLTPIKVANCQIVTVVGHD